MSTIGELKSQISGLEGEIKANEQNIKQSRDNYSAALEQWNNAKKTAQNNEKIIADAIESTGTGTINPRDPLAAEAANKARQEQANANEAYKKATENKDILLAEAAKARAEATAAKKKADDAQQAYQQMAAVAAENKAYAGTAAARKTIADESKKHADLLDKAANAKQEAGNNEGKKASAANEERIAAEVKFANAKQETTNVVDASSKELDRIIKAADDAITDLEKRGVNAAELKSARDEYKQRKNDLYNAHESQKNTDPAKEKEKFDEAEAKLKREISAQDSLKDTLENEKNALKNKEEEKAQKAQDARDTAMEQKELEQSRARSELEAARQAQAEREVEQLSTPTPLPKTPEELEYLRMITPVKTPEELEYLRMITPIGPQEGMPGFNSNGIKVGEPTPGANASSTYSMSNPLPVTSRPGQGLPSGGGGRTGYKPLTGYPYVNASPLEPVTQEPGLRDRMNIVDLVDLLQQGGGILTIRNTPTSAPDAPPVFTPGVHA
jgi:hypothetical protein